MDWHDVKTLKERVDELETLLARLYDRCAMCGMYRELVEAKKQMMYACQECNDAGYEMSLCGFCISAHDRSHRRLEKVEKGIDDATDRLL